MIGCGPFPRGSRLAFVLLAGAAWLPATAIAQTPTQVPDEAQASALRRLQALEQQIQARQAELEAYRAELIVLRRQLTPGQPVARQPPANYGICRLSNMAEVDHAFLNPSALPRCIQPVAGSVAPALPQGPPEAGYDADSAAQLAVSSPNRPRITPGISTVLEFANRGRANVTLTHPIIYRTIRYRERPPEGHAGNEFLGFRPQLLTISAGLSVPIVKDESNFLSLARRPDAADIDVLSGTTVRLGVDFFNFRDNNREQSIVRLARFLWRARRACTTERARELPPGPAMTQDQFFGLYGLVRTATGHDEWKSGGTPAADANRDACSGMSLVNFVLETESDGQGGSQFKRAAFAADYQATFWEEPQAAIPHWGLGGSIEYGTTDFRYRQGSLLIGPNSATPPRLTLALDRTMPLAAQQTETQDDWRIQAYGAFFISNSHARRPPIGRMYTPGVMLVGAASYLSAHQFRPGAADVSVCPLPGQANPNDLSIGCSSVNIDRPYFRDGITLSGELRTQFFNVPVLRILGFAPRYSHRLSDGRQSFELPVYLMPNAAGWGSAGIRYRRQWDGTDLLGNPEITTSEISVFLSGAINFRGN
jgi:hypothetical protein